MITREQIYTMLMMKNRTNTFFSALPIEIIKEISDYGQNPNTKIAIALNHAAYARKENVEALLVLLDNNPNLLLQAGNVTTPGGDEVRRVTLYEFLLGAGDYELAEKVQVYFSKIKNGELEWMRQYERYRPHIENMKNQKPYDLSPLIELIKKSSPEEVKALLIKHMTGESELYKAIIQFRKDWAPRILLKPCMHYNYASLQQAFELLDKEFDNLYKASGNNDDMINLVWKQLIGLEMIRLPGIDRCVMAQGIYYVIEQKEALARSYIFRNGGAAKVFPVASLDDSLDGLGGDFSVRARGNRGRCYETGSLHPIGKLMSNKYFKLTELLQPHPNHQPSSCVII